MDPNQNDGVMSDHDQSTTSTIKDNTKRGPIDAVVVDEVNALGSQGPIDGNGAACTNDVQTQTPSTSQKRELGEAPPRKQRLTKRTRINSDEGVNENEVTHGIVQTLDGLPVERRLFNNHHSSNYRDSVSDNGMSYTRIFQEDGFAGAGRLCLTPLAEKARKNTQDNSYVFCVVEGIVHAQIHNTTGVIRRGGMFQVPRGNIYNIKNPSTTDSAHLVFMQARLNHANATPFPQLNNPPPVFLDEPLSKTVMLLTWLIQLLKARYGEYRSVLMRIYKRRVAQYMTTQRLCLLCFILGLAVRRLPFVGSPPILNIQLIGVR